MGRPGAGRANPRCSGKPSPTHRGGVASTFQRSLADVAAGHAHVLQAGDCAEDPTEYTAEHVERKLKLLDALADVMVRPPAYLSSGWAASPVSTPSHGRGPPNGSTALNCLSIAGTWSTIPRRPARRADPTRSGCSWGIGRQRHTITALRTGRDADSPVWTSHEALVLDYEIPMLRRDRAGRLVLDLHPLAMDR